MTWGDSESSWLGENKGEGSIISRNVQEGKGEGYIYKEKQFSYFPFLLYTSLRALYET